MKGLIGLKDLKGCMEYRINRLLSHLSHVINFSCVCHAVSEFG